MYGDQKQIQSSQDGQFENEFGHHQISNQIFNFPITKLHDQNVLVTIHGDWIFLVCPKKNICKLPEQI